MALVTRMTSEAISRSVDYTIGNTPELKGKTYVAERDIIVLQFWNQGLTTVSLDILRFRNIQVLHLSGNGLETLPDFIAQLPHLKKLFLDGNKLRKFPCLPPGLEHLYLTRNEITAIPSLQSSRLKTLHVDQNQIRELPQDPFPDSIESLNLSHNQIVALPLTNPLPALQCLVITDNRLRALPSVLSKSEKLWKIDLQRNPTFPLPDCIRKVIVVSSSPARSL